MKRPMPKRLLIHSATLKGETGVDTWQKPIAGTDTELTNVRLDHTDRLTQTKDNKEVRLKHILYYDARNSRPKDVDFSTYKSIEFDGELCKIEEIRKIYDDSRIHHIEIGLI